MPPKRKKVSRTNSKPVLTSKVSQECTDEIEDDTLSREYTVHCIRDHIGKPGSRKFLVSWVGYPGQDTWVDEEILREDVPHKVIGYLNRKKIKLVGGPPV